jgi:archaellum component FlaC
MLIDSLKQLTSGAAAVNSTGKTTKSQTAETSSATSAQSRGGVLQQQLETLSRWSISADVSHQLAKNQQAEQQIRQLYQQLEQLKKQLEQPQSSGQKQQISQQLQQLESQLKQKNTALTPDLQLSSQPSTQSQWQLNSKIDLLSPRKQPETLVIGLVDGQRIQLHFPAGQSADANLSMMQQEFANHQIELKQQGPALVFSTNAAQSHLLSQPWQMQGEGIRIAAGNPVQLRLQKPEGQLNLLAQQAQQMENQQAYQAQLNQVQQKLQQLLRQVQSERQVLAAKLNTLRMADSQQSEVEVAAVSQELKVQMRQGAASSLSAIMAQGNVTRSLVEFALSD